MFFLPLPFTKMLETLGEVKHLSKALTEPKLHIILNGKSTKQQVVWRSLVNVDLVKIVAQKLKAINWLYKNMDDKLVDGAAKQVIKKSPITLAAQCWKKLAQMTLLPFKPTQSEG